MTDRRRNALIGLFVLGGLVALGVLIIKFGESRWLFSRGYVIQAKFDSVIGVREGTEVRLAGVPVGRVWEVDLLRRDNPTEGVVAWMEIRREFKVPVGWRAHVVTPLMGQPVINIVPPTGMIPTAMPAQELRFQPQDGKARIGGELGTPLEEIIDPTFMATLEKTTARIGELAKALTPAADAVRDLLERRTIKDVEADEELTANLSTVVERLQKVLTHIDTVLGDPANQLNLKEALANLRTASEDAKLAFAHAREFGRSAELAATDAQAVLFEVYDTVEAVHYHVDELGPRLVETSDKLSKLLDNFIEAGRLLTEGDGTMALLLRQPKFHEALMLTVERLGEAAFELTALVKQWQRKGLLTGGG